jgi:2-phosphoglycerate kinase
MMVPNIAFNMAIHIPTLVLTNRFEGLERFLQRSISAIAPLVVYMRYFILILTIHDYK